MAGESHFFSLLNFICYVGNFLMKDWAAENCCLQYRAPELFHIETNSIITEKADIFSLGGILYAMLFGRGPFDDVYSRGDSVALAATSGVIDIPKSQALTYPKEIVEFMLVMLQTDAEKRPGISEVIEHFKDLSCFTMDQV
ncbi:unnamed protein product [Didymodactylos carnosus]|uniref:non-specific serine/threonine protein kinase n=1 Tax=Didymodactylos carnosus TaxID=1234261 RepID=A0A814ST45_9BILA|nr:unnamed protein product [Didymodactylos carnosus]CAF3915613.1 unnamed protein product [Didymodactylos carnosus]